MQNRMFSLLSPRIACALSLFLSIGLFNSTGAGAYPARPTGNVSHADAVAKARIARSGSAPAEPCTLTTTDLTSTTVDNVAGNGSPDDLVRAILGVGVTFSNATFVGTVKSAGTFTGGADIGFDTGIILSSGSIKNAEGPNVDDGITGVNALPGDVDLDTLTTSKTKDATLLEFDFVPNKSTVSFQYVFGSDEYNEFVNASFNDVFGFFVNGVNVALLPSTTTTTNVVSINNVNNGNPFGTNPKNPQFYRNNDLDDGGGSICTEMDGLTVVLNVVAAVNPNVTNHIKMAIADAQDSSLDSNVFLAGGSFTANTPPTVTCMPDITNATNPVTLTTQVADADGEALTVTWSVDGVVVKTDQVPANAPTTSATLTFTNTFTPGPHQVMIKVDDGNVATTCTTNVTITPPTLSINDVTVTEGDSGTVTATFTVTRSGTTSTAAGVQYATANGTATAGTDYIAETGTVNFAAGQTTQSVTVVVNGDTTFEANEQFFVNLTAPVGATLADAQGAGTITNDDLPPPGPLTGIIAFSSSRDGNNEIYTMKSDGTNPVRLTNNPAVDDQPHISRDGRLIVFSSLRDFQREIYVMSITGTNLRRLTSNGYDDYQPQFSPDGTKIVFTSVRNGNPEIYIMNAGGTGQTRLTSNDGADDHPSFNANGTQIVFHSYRLSNHEIYRMNADGTAVRRLTNIAGTDTNPNYSPDGSRIVFQSNRVRGQNEIYLMNADGTGQKRISFHALNDALPCFSPDGTRLAFTTTRGATDSGDNEIALATLAGEQVSGAQALTRNLNDDSGPSWARTATTGGISDGAAASVAAASVAAASVMPAAELSANESSSILTLTFAETAPQNAAALKFTVSVNGKAVVVQSVTVQGNSVNLALPDGALPAGATVSVSFDGHNGALATNVP